MSKRWIVAVSIVLGLAVAADASAQPANFRVLTGASPVGSTDGPGAVARFNVPIGIAVNSAGTIYVTDTWNVTIRAITPAGVVSTFAGQPDGFGTANGTGSAAQFNLPQSAAVDGADNLYVADTFNHTIRKITPAGVVTTLAGQPGSSGFTDGTGSGARFNGPLGIAVDAAGNVYVSDTNNQTIRMVTPAGVVTTVAGSHGLSGSTDGTGSAARFNQPRGIAVDPAGVLYVSDGANSTIRKIAAGGVVTTLAGLAGSFGSVDGTGSAARFYQPWGLAIDSAGTTLYVAETLGGKIRQVTLPGAVVTTKAGSGLPGGVDGTTTTASFGGPQGVAVDAAGNVYVADTGNDTIRKIAGGTVTTLAGFYGSFGAVDGPAGVARLASPGDIAADANGNLYTSDGPSNTIRKISPAGTVTTLAGLAGTSGSTDGTGSAARFSGPQGVAVDAAGNVYVADNNNRTIRMITPAGVVTTLAGLAGATGTVDGMGSAARFSSPNKLAVDNAGNVYVSDAFSTIRKIAPGGIVTTLAGLAGSQGSTDGTGSAARFNNPRGVAVDAAGNVFVTDSNNDTIRKITPGGVVTTLAGLAGSFGSQDGTGSGARFGGPSGIAINRNTGTLYVADTSISTIRKVTPAGVVTTIAGCQGCIGSDGLFNHPFGIAVNPAGVVYVADTFNNTVQVEAPSRSSVVLDFGPAYGLWIRVGSAWRQLNPRTTEGMLTLSDGNQDALLIDFGPGVGVWFWESDAQGNDFWFQLTPNSPTEMVALDTNGDGYINYGAFSFPGQGVWLFNAHNNNWSQLHPLDASHLAAADLDGDSSDDLIIDFPGAGLWVYYTGTGTWAQLVAADASALITADVDGNGTVDAVANFPGAGVWSYRAGLGWSQINPNNAARLTAGDLDYNGRTDLVFDFGAGVGIWVLQNGTTWWQLTPLTGEGLKTADVDANGHAEVIVDFGASGVWSYEDLAGWQMVAPLNPTAIATGRFF